MRRFRSLSVFSIFVLFFIFLTNQVIAQEDDFSSYDPSNKVVPPSPTASALGKYGDVPVGLYTGIPNISVPLYNFQSKILSIPIGLNYHAGGIKVDDVAGWTGLGWSLSCNYVITRTVRGLPDESIAGYQNNPIFNNFDVNDYSNNSPESLVPQDIQSMEQGFVDGEPDLFHFNFPGGSGKFVINSQGEFLVQPYQDILIEKVSNSVFMITTPDGTKYTFSDTEITSSFTFATNNSLGGCDSERPSIDAITAWYLTSIEDANHMDQITFEYAPYNVTYASNISSTEYFHSALVNFGSCSTVPPKTECLTLLTTTGKQLVRVVSSIGTTAEFTGTDNRLDLVGAKKLEEISIKKGNQSLRTFDFNYQYYNSSGFTPISDDPSLFKRLKLKNIVEHSASGESKPPYVFYYLDEEDSSLYSLPPRLSFDQDHWGYYNGAENTTFLPSHFFPSFPHIGGDRSAHSEHTKAGLLWKIQYPTGGHTAFEFESHLWGSFTNSDLLLFDSHYIDVSETSTANKTSSVGGPIEDVTIFEIPYDLYATYNIQATNSQVEWNGDINLVNEQGVSLCGDQGLIDLSTLPCGSTPENGLTGTLFLEAGLYTITTIASIEGDLSSLTLDWQEHEIYESGAIDLEGSSGIAIGGVRVKSMTDNPDDGGGAKHTSFSYNLHNDQERSSGKLIGLPRKYDFTMASYRGSCDGLTNNQVTCEYMGLSASNRAPLSSAQGSHIVYTNVTSYNEGKTEYTYSYEGDTGGQGWPYGSQTSYDWKRGLLLEQVDYKNDITGFSEIKRTKNIYDFRENEILNSKEAFGLIVGKDIQGEKCSQDILGVNEPRYHFRTYKFISHWFNLALTETTLDGVTTITDYEYDELGRHTGVTASEMENSDGKTHRTEMNYPHDLEPEMVEKFMIASPLEVIKSVDGFITGGVYVDMTSFGDKILPELIYRKLRGGQNFLQTTLDYYPDGYLRTADKTGWGTESYEWQDGLITGKTFFDREWSWNWDFNGHRQLLSFTNFDGVTQTFDYDDFQRLSLTDNGLSNTTYLYNYLPNFVDATVAYSDETEPMENKTTYDGLGRMFVVEGIEYGPQKQTVEFEKANYDNAGRNTIKAYMINTFSSLDYEASPLGRVEREINPNNYFKELQYLCNEAGEVLGYDDACELYKQIIVDENGNPTTSFTDKVGRTVATVDALGNVTSYEYEDTGWISKINSPAGEFIYTYDDRGRVLSKVIPDGGTTTFDVYDDRDLLLTSTNANSKTTTSTYDEYGQMATLASEDRHVQFAYENGRLVMERSQILGEGFVIKDYSYDSYGRLLGQGIDTPYGSDSWTYTPNAAGNVLDATRNHEGPLTFTMNQQFSYDHSGRQITTWEQINSEAPVISSKKKYTIRDELSVNNLLRKGNSGFLQKVNYGYDVMGWITNINDTTLPKVDERAHSCGLPTGQAEKPTKITTDLETILNLINTDVTIIIGGQDCDPVEECTDCPPDDCTADCTPAIEQAQADYIDVAYAAMNIPAGTTQLYLVELCNGDQAYLFDTELSHLPGEVAVISSVLLSGDYEIVCDGTQLIVPASTLVDHRRDCKDFLITGNNCSFIENVVTRDCDYTITLDNLNIEPVPDTRTIEVCFGRTVTSNCGEDDFVTSSRTLTTNRFSTYTNTNESIHLSDSSYISQFMVTIVYPLTGESVTLPIICEPDQVLTTYPHLSGNPDLNANDLYFSAAAPELMENAISLVFEIAIETYQIQNNVQELLYHFEPNIHYSGDLVFNFASFEAGEIPYVGLCGRDNFFLQYTSFENSDRGDKVTLNPVQPSYSETFSFFESYQTPCGVIRTGYTFTINYEGDICGTLAHTITDLQQGDFYYPPGSKTPFSLQSSISCTITETEYTLDCGPVISICNGAGCTPCNSSGSSPNVVNVNDGFPCDEIGIPNCLPGLAATQTEQMADIFTAMEDIDLSALSYPISITLIQLCDGSTYYILDEFLDDIDGEEVLQTITFNSPDDLVDVTIMPENDLWGMRFNYHQAIGELDTPGYHNGNIASMAWKTSQQAVQYYGFQYDKIDRLKKAQYQAKYLELVQGGELYTERVINIDRYSVPTIVYDPAGNIEELVRYGYKDCQGVIIDDLTYTNVQNRLQRVQDQGLSDAGFLHGTSSYTYDAAGNMLTDAGKGLDITYSTLNLPKEITMQSGTSIDYIYDGSGEKIKTITESNGETMERLYIGGVNYVDNELHQIATEYGSIVYDPPGVDSNGDPTGGFRRVFTMTDHLGNARISFSDFNDDGFITTIDDPDTPENEVEITQELHYYPFGMEQDGEWHATVNPENHFRYNGKEFDEEIGLYDYGARYYDPAIARWGQVDPLADSYVSYSPYNYVLNNPISLIDPDGKAPEGGGGPGGSAMGWLTWSLGEFLGGWGKTIDTVTPSVTPSVAQREDQGSTSETLPNGVVVKQENYIEIKSSTTYGFNFGGLFDLGNYATMPDGSLDYQGPPVIGSETKESEAVVSKASVSTKVRGVDVKSTVTNKENIDSGVSSMSVKVQAGIGNNALYFQNSKSGTAGGFQFQQKIPTAESTRTTVYQLQIEWLIPNG